MFPSPSLGPPLLSPSLSPALAPWGIPPFAAEDLDVLVDAELEDVAGADPPAADELDVDEPPPHAETIRATITAAAGIRRLGFMVGAPIC
jgi:hypothetical protein